MVKIIDQVTGKQEGKILHKAREVFSRQEILKRIETIRGDLKSTNKILVVGCIILLGIFIKLL